MSFSFCRLFVLGTLCLASGAAEARPLVLAVGGEPELGFDPVMGWGLYGSPLFQATLLRRDAQLDFIGDLATKWTASADRLVWNVQIRTDAKFSDGTPLTVEDVAFTYETARKAGGLVDLSVLDAVRVTGSDTIEFVLKRPQISFLSQMATLGIVPAKSYGKDYGRAPVGAGPFRMLEWRQGEQLVVEPNPYWFGGDIPFERVTFVFGSEETAMALAHSGVADLVAVPPARADVVPPGMALLNVKSVDNRGISFPMVASREIVGNDGVPVGNDVTADPAIRQAIDRALDRQQLVDLAVSGHGRPAYGPADGLPWDNAEARVSDNDPQGARQLLAAAGWTDQDGDGVLERDGRAARFSLLYPASDSTRQVLALGVAQQLHEIGIDARPEGLSWPELGRRMHSEAVVFGWGSHDPLEVFNLYHSGRAGIDYLNPGYYANPVVDAHFAQAESAPDFTSSLDAWKAAQWDGTTGFGSKGDTAWAWLVNIDHPYWVSDCLDLGPLQLHPHGHGFPITHDLPSWRWTCE